MTIEVAVLGGGNGSHASVADFCRAGHSVRWWRRPGSEFANTDGSIAYSGDLGEGVAIPSMATHDLAAAVAGADLIVAPLPGTVQGDLLPRLAEVLESGQAVAFTPGTFVTWIGAGLRPDVVWLETGTLPYLARIVEPGRVAIPVVAHRLPVGAIPGEGAAADRAHEAFAAVFPMAVRVTDGLDAALTNWGPIVHPPLLVHNLGAIASLGDRFDIHSEGSAPVVKRTTMAIDAERIELRKAMGLPGEHWPMSTHYEKSPLGMYPPDGHDKLVASNLWRESISLDHRYLHEDVLQGLVLNVSLGRIVGHPMPASEAILTLLGVALELDPFAVGRTAESIGAADLDAVKHQAREGRQ